MLRQLHLRRLLGERVCRRWESLERHQRSEIDDLGADAILRERLESFLADAMEQGWLADAVIAEKAEILTGFTLICRDIG